MNRALAAMLVVGLAGVGARTYYVKRAAERPQFITAPATQGDIIEVVASTGTLEAVTTVQVGSQVSGTVSWLGADFNSLVHKGEVIAKLDPSLMQAQLDQARANLNQATANLTKSESDLEGAHVALTDAQQKYTRACELAARSLIPRSDLDAAKIAVDTADASVVSQKSAVDEARAEVVQSKAAVNQAQVNLDHTIITAPIDGIVVQRSVDVGQTVAASLQSPNVFSIAADLTKMQVDAAVDEADIGKVRVGQSVAFTVDAYPGQPFSGTVTQIRLQPNIVQNVTTYSTIITVDNQELLLKPGMTANTKIEVARTPDVLRIPAAALRFRPTETALKALGVPIDLTATGPRVWIVEDGSLIPVAVKPGATDGTYTQILSGALEAGTTVVTGIAATQG